MFFKKPKNPVQMTDAEMGARLKELGDSLDRLKITAPCVAIAIACVGVVAGIFAMSMMPAVGIPLAIMAAGIGGGAVALSGSAVVRSRREEEIFNLSEENKEREFTRNLAGKVEGWKQDEEAKAQAEALRKAFDKALGHIAEGRGTEQAVTVRRPLQFRKPEGTA